jgi:hypothetical protein
MLIPVHILILGSLVHDSFDATQSVVLLAKIMSDGAASDYLATPPASLVAVIPLPTPHANCPLYGRWTIDATVYGGIWMYGTPTPAILKMCHTR